MAIKTIQELKALWINGFVPDENDYEDLIDTFESLGIGIQNIIEDIDPELGGNLDANNNNISSVNLLTGEGVVVATVNANNLTVNENILLSGDVTISDKIRITPDTTPNDDGVPAEGDIYANSTDNRLKYYDGTSYKNILLEGDVTEGLGSVFDDKTPILGNNLNVNGFNLSNIGSIVLQNSLGSGQTLINKSGTASVFLDSDAWANASKGSFQIRSSDGEGSYVGDFRISDDLQVVGLSGTGNRMVVADGVGNLSTQIIPSGGGSDNLGNHIATQDLDLQLNDIRRANTIEFAYLDGISMGIRDISSQTIISDEIRVRDAPTDPLDAVNKAYFDANSGGSDNLGNHIATQSLNMSGYPIIGAGNIDAQDIILSGNLDVAGNADFINVFSNFLGSTVVEASELRITNLNPSIEEMLVVDTNGNVSSQTIPSGVSQTSGTTTLTLVGLDQSYTTVADWTKTGRTVTLTYYFQSINATTTGSVNITGILHPASYNQYSNYEIYVSNVNLNNIIPTSAAIGTNTINLYSLNSSNVSGNIQTGTTFSNGYIRGTITYITD